MDRSSEEPDGEADRPSHYAEGGSGTKGTSPGKQQNAGSESPKPGRRRHSRRSSQDFDMMMRAESAGPGGGDSTQDGGNKAAAGVVMQAAVQEMI